MLLILVPLQLSQQILDLFQACQQHVTDLKKKDVCRAELQREIQQIFPRRYLDSWFELFAAYYFVSCLSFTLSREQAVFGWLFAQWVWHKKQRCRFVLGYQRGASKYFHSSFCVRARVCKQ